MAWSSRGVTLLTIPPSTALCQTGPATYPPSRDVGPSRLSRGRLPRVALPHTCAVFASSNYPPDQEAADRFVAEMRNGTLIACAPGGYPQVSILPFVKNDDVIELHCVQADPTLPAVRANPHVTFFVSDFLAWSPHNWVDEQDAGRATLHFRAVAFECDVERTSTDPD